MTRTRPQKYHERTFLSVLCLLASDGIAIVRFSNRPYRVKRFQTTHQHSVDVAHGLALLFGIGTEALPVWDSKTGWINLMGGLAVR